MHSAQLLTSMYWIQIPSGPYLMVSSIMLRPPTENGTSCYNRGSIFTAPSYRVLIGYRESVSPAKLLYPLHPKPNDYWHLIVTGRIPAAMSCFDMATRSVRTTVAGVLYSLLSAFSAMSPGALLAHHPKLSGRVISNLSIHPRSVSISRRSIWTRSKPAVRRD